MKGLSAAGLAGLAGVTEAEVRDGGRNPLGQALHELHVRSGHELDVTHGTPLCQDSAKPSSQFQGSRIAAANGTTPATHR